jgi:hypothetical protein
VYKRQVKRRVDGFVFAEQDESGSAKTDHQNDADDAQKDTKYDFSCCEFFLFHLNFPLK